MRGPGKNRTRKVLLHGRRYRERGAEGELNPLAPYREGLSSYERSSRPPGPSQPEGMQNRNLADSEFNHQTLKIRRRPTPLNLGMLAKTTGKRALLLAAAARHAPSDCGRRSA
eukprot:3303698-Rhodomonas_salina.1